LGSGAIAPEFVEPQRTSFDTEMNCYRSLIALCKRAPSSERNACADEASLGRARPEPVG